jgi:hypothetical protein
MRVLLVEDDLLIGALAERRLATAEIRVDWVSDGGGARTALTKGGYDVVIVDFAVLNARQDPVAVQRDLEDPRIPGGSPLLRPGELRAQLLRMWGCNDGWISAKASPQEHCLPAFAKLAASK